MSKSWWLWSQLVIVYFWCTFMWVFLYFLVINVFLLGMSPCRTQQISDLKIPNPTVALQSPQLNTFYHRGACRAGWSYPASTSHVLAMRQPLFLGAGRCYYQCPNHKRQYLRKSATLLSHLKGNTKLFGVNLVGQICGIFGCMQIIKRLFLGDSTDFFFRSVGPNFPRKHALPSEAAWRARDTMASSE